jgi:hypothetical protein
MEDMAKKITARTEKFKINESEVAHEYFCEKGTFAVNSNPG